MSDWKCSKCGASAGAPCETSAEAAVLMEAPPYNNDYGRKIQAQTCFATWEAWKKHEIMVINEYRLNLIEREDRAKLREAMHQFLSLSV